MAAKKTGTIFKPGLLAVETRANVLGILFNEF